MKKKKCLECGSLIDRRSTYCYKCFNKGERGSRWNKDIDHTKEGLIKRKKELNALWYKKNISSIKKRVKKNYDNSWEYCVKRQKEYKKKNIIAYRKYLKEYNKDWKKRNKTKVNAQNMAKKYVPLKDCCEICGSTKRLQRHHWRYDKPLLVTTLCNFCHQSQHKKRVSEVE